MEPHINNIVRCHTDGFISKTPITGIDLGDKIGQFKTKQGLVFIKSAGCKPEWLDE